VSQRWLDAPIWDNVFEKPLGGINVDFEKFKNIKADYIWMNDDLACADYQDYRKNDIAVRLHHWDFFSDIIIVNPVYQLYKIFPPNWFQIIMDAYFQLKPKYRIILDDFKASHFTEYTIAIQIRVPLATGIQALPNDHIDAPPVPDKELFYQAAETLSYALNVPYSNVTWFIATQDDSLLQWFKATRSGPVVWYESKKTLAFDMGPDNMPGKIAATLTNYLMSESNDIIVMDSSSFGAVAAARGGLIPVVCSSYQICVRKLSPTPIFAAGSIISKVPCLKQMPNYPLKLRTVDQTAVHFASLWKVIENIGKTPLLKWRE